MHPAKIQYELKKRGITQAQAAREEQLSTVFVSAVVNKRSVSARLMRAIAARIECDVREVFPEYFLQPPKRSHSKVNI